MSNRSKVLIKSLITAGLLAFFLFRMDWTEFLKILSAANWGLIALSCLLYFCTVFFVTTRWKVILSNFGIGTPWKQLMRIYLIGYFFNMFMPSAIGGDFFRAYYLAKREGSGMSTAITTTVLDRLSGLSALLIIGLVASVVNPIEVQGRSLTWIFVGVGMVFLAALAAMFHRSVHRTMIRLLERFHWIELSKKAQLVFNGLNRLRGNSGAILIVMLLSFGVQLLVVVVIWVAALSLHFDSDFHWFMLFIPIINLATAIPLTINGVGLRESVYFLLFSQIGVPMEKAVTLSLLTLLVYTASSVVGGVVYSFYKKDTGFSLSEIASSEAEVKQAELGENRQE